MRHPQESEQGTSTVQKQGAGSDRTHTQDFDGEDD